MKEKPLKDSVRAYVAGLFDAEGVIGIYKSKDSRHGGMDYKVYVSVTNTYEPVVQYLASLFGGTVKTGLPKKGRRWYRWQIISQKAISFFLDCVYEYATNKKPQMDVVREYIALNGDRSPAKREELYKRCSELKKQECVEANTLDTVQPKYIRPCLAGWFDGEGSLIISAKKGGGFRIEATLTNTYYSVVKMFADMFGGSYFTSYKNGTKVHRWRCTRAENIRQFVLEVVPYLMVKREKALLMLEYLRMPDTTGRLDVIRRSELLKIESDLTGNSKSDPAVTQAVQ